ncbi:MAG: putative DNA binding domain-containing protein [Desulfobacteraceae bacterium]|nr:putative DNA binding domain-containing protein [Desulfobacteraceae bacterium]
MNKKQLIDLIKLGEGFTVEFKKSGTSNIGRELCAFANATGGFLLIGVSDSGDIVGAMDHNKLKSQIQSIARSMEPPLVLDIESVGKVLVVSVPAQNSKPYSFAGKFYLRDGASSQQMSRDEIREFFFKEGVIHFDETPCESFKLNSDLKPSNWTLFAKRANIPENMKPVTALENLHLLKNKKVSQAGAWLLCDDITRFNISGNVSCALFMGNDKARILDRKDFSGDVYSMIDSVMTYILTKINTELIIEKVKREERPELPEEALREAVVNALAHRDYRSTANVQIYIFQDRVEIVSPGGLPAGMVKADLGKKSIPRNPLLFSMLYRMNAVEHIGSGINRIHRACKDYGIKAPIVQVEGNWVSFIFLRPGSKKDPTIQGTMQGTMQDTMQATMQADREKEILDFCQTPRSRKEIQNHIKISNRDYFRKEILNPFIQKGLLKMTIPEKPRSPKQKYYSGNKEDSA